jgi:hypothetical protein
MAYDAVRNGLPFVVVDEIAGTPVDALAEGSLQFSPDGEHVMYGAWRGDNQIIVEDGQPSAEYAGIDLGVGYFSPTGKRYAFIAYKSRPAVTVMVSDGNEGPAMDAMLSLPVYAADETLVYLAAKDGWLYRVEQKPPH